MVSASFAQEQPPARVAVQSVVRETMAENRSYIGTLQYDRISNVSSEVTGLVERILVQEGAMVDKEEELILLDTEILDKEIALQETRIEQIALRRELAAKNLQRLDTLLARKGTSEKNYDDALFAYQDSLADHKGAELELKKLLIKKRKSVIQAPFAGIILSKNIESGDWVQQGKELVSIASTQDLVVRVPVEETVLPFVQVGETVPVVINAYIRELSGTISRINPQADPRTKNVSLIVSIPLQDDVAENMSATVYIATSAKKELSVIPRDALVKFQGKDFVFTVKEGKAAMMPVNIVSYLGDRVGADNPYLTPGMPVVIEGNERLRPDQPVMVEGEN